MSRLDRLLIAVVALLALTLGANALTAVGGWVSTWQAYTSLTMGLTDVRLIDGEERIEVGLVLENGSPTPLEILEIEGWVHLNGRYISGARLRSPDLWVPPGERVETRLHAPVYQIERAFLDEQQATGALRWRVDGRVLVRGAGLGEPTWVRYIDWRESP